jgi:hypothetical protein
MRLLSAMLLVVGLLACGCATRAGHPMMLMPVQDFNVNYSGELGRRLAEDLPQYTQPEGEPSILFELEVRILRGSAPEAEAAFGKRVRVVGAWHAESTNLTAERLSKLQVVSAPRLTVYENQQGTIAVTNEIAYVSGFEVVGAFNGRLADPIIDIITEGLILGLQAKTVDEKQMRLSVDLTLAEVVRPIASQHINVLGAPVTIQTPVIYSQRLKGEGQVSEDRVLVLTGMVDQENVYVILITGHRQTLEESTEPMSPEEK